MFKSQVELRPVSERFQCKVLDIIFLASFLRSIRMYTTEKKKFVRFVLYNGTENLPVKIRAKLRARVTARKTAVFASPRSNVWGCFCFLISREIIQVKVEASVRICEIAAEGKYIFSSLKRDSLLLKCSAPDQNCFDNGADSRHFAVFKRLELF